MIMEGGPLTEIYPFQSFFTLPLGVLSHKPPAVPNGPFFQKALK